MRKKALQTFLHRGHIESKSERNKRRITYLARLCQLIEEQDLREIA